jgi:hypothetical protein
MRDHDQEFRKEVWRFLEGDEKPHSKSDNRKTKKNNDAKGITEEHTISDQKAINSSQCSKKPHDPKSRFLFYQEGNFWRIGPTSSAGLLKSLIGIKHLHLLLRHPEHFFTPVEVYNAGMEFQRYVEDQYVTDENTNDEFIQRIRRMSQKELKDALGKLKEDKDSIAEDPETEIQRKELTQLVKKALKDRQGSGDSARADKPRTNVTKAIRHAISEITKTAPSMAQYLNKETVKTGNTIWYAPVPSNTPNWILFQSELPKDTSL